MSSFSSLNSQGKGDKKKYSAFNINDVYKGKAVEIQKNTAPRQHGLQSLGKVPTTRRVPPPVNLPSLKSENSGNDPTVNLVPSGPASSGWGVGKNPSQPQPSDQQQSQQLSRVQQGSTTSSNLRSATASVTSATNTVTGSGGSSVGTASHQTSQYNSAATKTWSSITGRAAEQERPPPPTTVGGKESVRFAREFPTLDGTANSGTGGKPGFSAQLDLRPQSYGSWREGGGKNITSDHQTESSQPPARPAAKDSASPDDPPSDNYRPPSNFNGRPSMFNQRPPSSVREDTLFKRHTIVKDRDIEDLGHKAANRASNDDSSWATATGDIDYSVKLVFSDDEDPSSAPSKQSNNESKNIKHKKPGSPDMSTSRENKNSNSRSPSRSEHRPASAGGAAYTDRDRVDRPHSGSNIPPPRDAWPTQYPPYGHPMMMQPPPRMPMDMWQRGVAPGGQSAGGASAPMHMPPGPFGPMPYRMPPYHAMQRPGPHGPEDDDEMWSKKQQQTHNDVSAALERAKSRRSDDVEGGRRSRSTSESSTEHPASRSRYNDRSKQMPPRFQQHKFMERSSDGPREMDRHNEDGSRPPPMHQPGQQQPPWSLGWPIPPPFMPGIGMPPVPPRPRKNSRGSDDDRRTPDGPQYTQQMYEMQMRAWYTMMREYAKANPDIPMPPMPPFGPIPPQMRPNAPQSAVPHHPSEGKEDGEKDSVKTKASEPVITDSSEQAKSTRKTPTPKVQEDPFGEESEFVRPPSNKSSSDKREMDLRRPNKDGAARDMKDEPKRSSKTEEKSSGRRHHEEVKLSRHSRSRDDTTTGDRDSASGHEGRKRRNEMSAPVPIIKEMTGESSSRTSQMVTLKRGGKTASQSAEKKMSEPAKLQQQSKVQQPKETQADVGKSAKSSENDKAAASSDVPAPKQSAWKVTPPSNVASLSDELLQTEKENRIPEDDKSSRGERSKVSPTLSDGDKPPVKRYKEEKDGRYERQSSRGRGSSGPYAYDRNSRRGGHASKSREFVRGGSVSAARTGGRGGGYSTRGSRSLSSRGGSSRGRGRGGHERYSTRGPVERNVESWEERETLDASVIKSADSTTPTISDSASSMRSQSTKAAAPTASDEKGSDDSRSAATTPAVDAPPPKENIWDKRKQELSNRDTPSPGAAESTTEPLSSDQKESSPDVEGRAEARKDEKMSAVGSKRPTGRTRPTRGTYTAPRNRKPAAPRFTKNSYHKEYHYDDDDEEDDGGYGYESYDRRDYSSSRGRSRGGGYASTRGRDSTRGRNKKRHDESTEKGPTIDQWNGPPNDDVKENQRERSDRHMDGSTSRRGRGRGRYPARLVSSRGHGRRAHYPSVPISPSKRRQDSSNTDDVQEEWETASESSEHLKDSAGQSSRNRNKEEEMKKTHEQPSSRSNGSTTHRDSGHRSYTSDRGRWRGAPRGGRGSYRGTRDGRRNRDSSPDASKSMSTSRKEKVQQPNGKPTTNASGSVYRVDDVIHDNPESVASALSGKNSELSDVSKPLVGKEKTTAKQPNSKEQTSSACVLDNYDLNDIAGVVIIDHLDTVQDDSDDWQDEDGFQEVVSRKTRKEKARQEQEAAVRAAMEQSRRDRALAASSKGAKKLAAQQAALAVHHAARKSKLPPRLVKQREEKMKQEKFKIENWDNNMLSSAQGQHELSNNPTRDANSKGHELNAEPPVPIGNWDQDLASTAVATAQSIPITSTAETSESSYKLQLTVSTTSISKPDKSSDQHDSGIDVSNDKDTGSVRSSPDAGSASMIAPPSLTSQAKNSFPSALPGQHCSLDKITDSSNLPPSTMKLDFTFDPDLQPDSSINPPVTEISASLNATGLQSSKSAANEIIPFSLKTLWDSPTSGSAKVPTSKAGLFGNQSSGNVFTQPSTDSFNHQVNINSKSFTPSSAAFSSDTFPVQNDGFQSFQSQNSGFAVNAASQSSTNLFSSNNRTDQNAIGAGTNLQPSVTSPNTQLLPSHGASSSGALSTSSTSVHSALDGPASVFTPSYHQSTNRLNSFNPTVSQNQGLGGNLSGQIPADNYQSFRNQASMSQPVALQQQVIAQAQMAGAGHTGGNQPIPLATQQGYPTGIPASQGYHPARTTGTTSIMTPMVKPSAVTPNAGFGTLHAVPNKAGISVSSQSQQPMFFQAYEVPGIIGNQSAGSQQGFRLPQQGSQANQQTQSSFYGNPSQPQSSIQPIGYFPQLSGGTTSNLQPTAASAFGVSLVQTPQGVLPQGNVVLSQQHATSGWGQQPTQNTITQQLKGGYKTPGSGPTGHSPMNAQIVSQINAPYQISSGGFGVQPAASNLTDISLNMAATGHMQQPLQASSAPPKWGNTSQSPDSSMLNAAGQMGAAQMMTQHKAMAGVKGGYPPSNRPYMSRNHITGQGQVLHSPMMSHQPRHTNNSSSHRPQQYGSGGGHNSSHRYPSPIQRPNQSRQPGSNNRIPKQPQPTGSKSSSLAANSSGGGSSGDSKYTSEDERKKMREEAVLTAKNFLNPDKAATPPSEKTTPEIPPTETHDTSPSASSVLSSKAGEPSTGGGDAPDATEQNAE